MTNDVLYDEKQLLEQLAASNEKAFDQLYANFADRLYGVAFAYTKSPAFSEEIVQDVFLKLWEKRENLAHIESLEKYIYTMTRNLIMDELKSFARERDAFKKLADFFSNNSLTPEQELSFKESNQLIEKAISHLSQQQQMVYRLAKQQGLTREEIALQLNISENTVRNHLARAMQYVREYVRQHSAGTLCLLALLLLEL